MYSYIWQDRISTHRSLPEAMPYRQMLHFEEPLHRQFRFDHYIGTFRVTYFICVSFCFSSNPAASRSFSICLHGRRNGPYRYIIRQLRSKVPLSLKISMLGKIILFTQHIVIYIVGRSYFQTTCTELNVYIIVLNDRDNTVYQRNDYLLSFQPLRFSGRSG